MKKMLVLALVLSVAGFASAGLLQDIKLVMETPGVVTVEGLVGGNSYAAAGFGIYVPGGAIEPKIQGPFAVYTAAGDLGAISQYEGYNGVDVAPNSSQAEGKPLVTPGKWFTFGYTGQVGSMLEIFDYSQSATVAIGQLQVTPEPMTMLLLGLGGLFLRKK